MLEKALLVDAQGRPIAQHHKVFSNAWDEIKAWSSEVYMPYDVAPIGRHIAPASTMHSAKIGAITATRFAYGIPVHIKDWDQDAGNAFVATTIGGTARHWVDREQAVETPVGSSFVVDCSRTDYWVDFDPDHLQFNLTIPHGLLERTALDWFGFNPGDALWQAKVGLGGAESSWLGLMDYVARSIAEAPERLTQGPLARHLEQTICVRLLNEWALRAGLDLNDPCHRLAPRTVRAAEQFMIEHAAELPTMADVARAVGTSVRTLSAAFRSFRGYPPSAFLREQRLQGVRRALSAAPPGASVSTIAAGWGYINMASSPAAIACVSASDLQTPCAAAPPDRLGYLPMADSACRGRISPRTLVIARSRHARPTGRVNQRQSEIRRWQTLSKRPRTRSLPGQSRAPQAFPALPPW